MYTLISICLLFLFSKDLRCISVNKKNYASLYNRHKSRNSTFLCYELTEERAIKKNLILQNTMMAIKVSAIIGLQFFLWNTITYIIRIIERYRQTSLSGLPPLNWSFRAILAMFFDAGMFVSSFIPYILLGLGTIAVIDYHLVSFTYGLKVVWLNITCFLLIHTALVGFGIIGDMNDYLSYHEGSPNFLTKNQFYNINSVRCNTQKFAIAVHLFWPILQILLYV